MYDNYKQQQLNLTDSMRTMNLNVPVGPTKVKAHKSEGTPEVEIMFVVIILIMFKGPH